VYAVATLDFTPLARALQQLRDGIAQADRHADDALQRDGAIQRYKYSFELCIKMMKRVLEMQFAELVDTMPFRDMLRSAFAHGLITDPTLWFGFRDDRNRTAHTYDENVAAIVFASSKRFLPEAEFLLSRLEQTNP
jgi:nucleotidyltransferase substrate binding protein (TIGR01987 family)